MPIQRSTMQTIQNWINSLDTAWTIQRNQYLSDQEQHTESIFTMTNGYYGCRANLELPSANRFPSVCIAGVYDKPDVADCSDAFGLTIKNKAITPAYAIAPLWNLVEITVDGEPLDFMNASIDAFSRTLDMQRGLLISQYKLTTPDGKTTQLTFLSAALLHERNHFVMQCELEPLNYSATVHIAFILEQPDQPFYLPRIKDYVSQTELLSTEEHNGNVLLTSQVRQTGEPLKLASSTRMMNPAATRQVRQRQRGIAETFTFTAEAGTRYTFERIAAITHGEATPQVSNQSIVELLEAHTHAWNAKWQKLDFSFAGDDKLLQGLRWSMFSLHALGNELTPDYSISATGLHGPGYFGHVFWDTEIFILPFFLLSDPQIAKNLLLYRYQRLDAARQVAIEHGFKGAKFPWTSTRDGYDVCPPDWERCGKRQIHISGDIAYAFQNYLDWTGDQDFFDECGVEVIVETARFYRSKMTEGDDGKLHILDIIGPDEYNIHADDNAYTNFLAQWNLRRAVSAMQELASTRPELHQPLADRLQWSDAEAAELLASAERIAFPRLRDGVCEQYQGFFDLKDPGAIPRDENNMPLEKQHSYDQGYQIIKQADAVMLHYLFPHEFDRSTQAATFDYYEKRNNFGSSLSPSISCIMGLRLGLAEHAYGYFRLTSRLDIDDLHIDKSSHEGIHAACTAGSPLCAFLGFAGLQIKDGHVTTKPTIPDAWSKLKFHFQFRGQTIQYPAEE